MVCHVSLRSWISSKHFCDLLVLPLVFPHPSQCTSTGKEWISPQHLHRGCAQEQVPFATSLLFLFIFIEGLWQPLIVVLTVTFNNTWAMAVIKSQSPSPGLSSVSPCPRCRLDGDRLTLQFRLLCLCTLLFYHFYFNLQWMPPANIPCF